MARDYGNKRPSRQRNSAPQQFLVIVVAFLLGYLTASIFDAKTLSQWISTQVLEQHEAKHATVKSEPQHAQVPPKPKFEFYTLLANEKGASQANARTNTAATKATVTPAPVTAMQATATSAGTVAVTTAAKNTVKPQINIKQPPVVKVAEGKALPPAQASGKGVFLVQVAAFKARQDAEHMKGLLTLKGFDVRVTPISNAKGNWFRVVVGPYANRQLAQQAQITLAKTERLHGMVTSAG